MGSGRYTVDADQSYRQSNPKRFQYSTTARRIHPDLDPSGVFRRECRDIGEHPLSTPIIVSLDQTGSMARVITPIHQNLHALLTLITDNDYVPDPEILFSCFGDQKWDRVGGHLQIGQFESDVRMLEQLDNMWLVGEGGGNVHESSILALWFAAFHTDLDSVNERGRKGYMFVITDEKTYEYVTFEDIQNIFGQDVAEQVMPESRRVPLTEIVAAVQQKFNLFVVIPRGGYYAEGHGVEAFWRDTVGPENVIDLADPTAISEVIGATMGMFEGAVKSKTDLADQLKRLGRSGVTDEVLKALPTGLGKTQSDSNALDLLDDDDDPNADGGTIRL